VGLRSHRSAGGARQTPGGARAASRGPIAAGASVVTLGPASAADGLLPIAAPAALAAWRQMTSA
jgi:hypothetical protein